MILYVNNRFQMRKTVAMGMLCSALWSGGSGAHTPLDPSRVIDFKISKSGLTRISIDNDTIEDVYAYPAEPDLVTHHKSGHVFLTPNDLEVPVYLTVITRRGTAQDLRLVPVSKKAEPVLLTDGTGEPASSASSGSSPQDRYASLLGQFVRGKVPDGFFLAGDVPNQAVEAGRGEGPVEAILDKVYQGPVLKILVFTLKNEGSERVSLDNRAFWAKGDDLASAFDRPTLDPRETARLFVVQHR